MLGLLNGGDQATHDGYSSLIRGDNYQRSTPEQRAALMRTFMQGQQTNEERTGAVRTRLDQLVRDTTGANGAHLRTLSDNTQFRALDARTQGRVLDRLGELNAAPDRQTFVNLATSPGLGRLPAAEQNRLLDYAGGANTVVSPGARHALTSMMGSQGFRDANADQQATWLRDYVRDQPGARGLRNRTTDPERAEYQLSAVQGRAGEYRVRIDGRDIPVTVPTNVNGTQQLLGQDGKPLQIDDKPAYVHTPDQVARSLAAMPAELRRMVNSVTLSGERNADDNAWNGRYNRDQQQEGRTPDAANYNDWAARYRQELRGPRSPFRSYASAGRAGDITFYPTSWDPRQQQAYIDSTIIHESGHTYSARNFPGFEQWDRARTSDAIVPSNYARNAATEDFSEALSLYYVVRGTPQEAELRRLLPARFEIIDQHFPGWTKR